MTKEEIQFDLLKTELTLTQQQMDKYDQLSQTTKTWAVTLWAASIGWSFQVNRADAALVGVIILIMFWSFDGLNKNFRQDYKKRRDVIAGLLNSLFKGNPLAADVISPALPSHRSTNALKTMFMPHIALPYIVLILVSFILCFRA